MTDESRMVRKIYRLLVEAGAACEVPPPQYARRYHIATRATVDGVVLTMSTESGPVLVVTYAEQARITHAWVSYETAAAEINAGYLQQDLTRDVLTYLRRKGLSVPTQRKVRTA